MLSPWLDATRDEKTGHTEVSSAELDESGAYGQWPEDFDDVHLAAESDYLDAAARRAATQERVIGDRRGAY